MAAGRRWCCCTAACWAVLPGTTHMQVTRRAELLLPMLAGFLD
jgi:hypothetical protein